MTKSVIQTYPREIAYRKDGRRILDPPCALGHTSETKECPACHEALSGDVAAPEWWKWFGKRYPKHRAAADKRAKK